jgi:hypothetical protein
MRLIIAGSRSITSYEDVKKSIETSLREWGLSPKDITEVVSGHAGFTKVDGKWLPNVDRLGERWAKENGIAVRLFPADWDRHGKRAGHMRNQDMARFLADNGGGYLVVVWDGVSKGSYSMIEYGNKYNLKIIVKTVRSTNV